MPQLKYWDGTQWVNAVIGVQGIAGPQGVQGIQGTTGTQGIQGTTGTQGTTGSQGTTGTQGIQGEIGAQGIQGETGTQGIQGIQGTEGTSGVISVTAPITNSGTSTSATLGIDTANFALLNAANTFSVSPQIINIDADANKGLVIKRFSATQSANLLEIQNQSGTAISYIDNIGRIFSGTFASNAGMPSAGGSFQATSTTGTAIIGRTSSASSTGDIQKWINSTNGVLSGINSSGQYYFGDTQTLGSQTFALTAATASSTTVATFTHAQTGNLNVGQQVIVAGVTPSYFNGTWTVTATGGSSGSFTFTVLGSGFTASGTGTGFGTFKASAPLSVLTPNLLTHSMVIKTVASQAANILEVISSSGTRIASIGPTGNGQFTGSVTVGAGSFIGTTIQEANQSASTITINTLASNTINTGPVRVRPRGATGMALAIQGANTSGLITAATANGTTITYTSNVSVFITAGQSVTITGIVSTGNTGATAGSGFNLTNATVASASGSQFTVTNSLVDTYTSGGVLTVTSSADLTQWQDPSGNIKAYINSAGAFVSSQLIGTAGYMYSVAPASFGSNGLTNSYQVQVVNGVTTRVALMVQGIAAQTADLQQWQSSAGTILASVNSGGALTVSSVTSGSYITTNGAVLTTDGINAIIRPFAGAGAIKIRSSSLTIPSLIVFPSGVSNTANLQEWQNSSGTVLASVSPSGGFTVSDLTINSSSIVFEGATADAHETTLTVTDPTADRTITFPDDSGTVQLRVADVSDTEIGYLNGVTSAIQTQIDTKAPIASPTFTGTVTIPTGSAISDVAYLNAANTFTTSPQQINGAASAVGLIVKANATTPGDLQQWQDSAGSVKASIGSGGNGVFNGLRSGSGSTTGAINAYTSAAQIGILVRGAASQTADLQQWQNSAGTVLADIDKDGLYEAQLIQAKNTLGVLASGESQIKVISPNGTKDIRIWNRNDAGGFYYFNSGGGSANVLRIDHSAPTRMALQLITDFTNGNSAAYGGRVNIDTVSTGVIGLVIRGRASQTADLQQWQNSAGTLLATIGATGNTWFRAGARVSGNYGGSQALLIQNDQNIIGLTIKANTTQTANLQQWQDSSGTELSSIDAAGNFTKGDGDQLVLAGQIFG